MKLSTRFRYGTRLLIDLGAHYHKDPVLLKEIAKRQKISKKYLEQIIISLKAAGLIHTVRGSKGGYCLTKDPKKLRLIEIYNILEGSTAPIECVDDPKACPYDLAKTCPTKNTWGKMKMAIENVLKNITLADLIRDWMRLTKKQK